MFDSVPIPHLSQYVGPWACEERAFAEGLAHVRTPELLQAHMAAYAAAVGSSGNPGAYRVTDGGVAIVELVGAMTKYGSSLSQMQFGTVGIRRAVRSAAANEEVRAIFLLIDSPGGTVAGTGDLAEDVARAAAQKPVLAFIEDMGASAAYWVASQATRIIANVGALVGSIGTYLVVDDFSGLYAQKGVKTHVIKAGKFKGAGIEGAPVTHEELVELQRVVDSINEHFLMGVAKGRRMSLERVRELADGRIHVGTEAKDLGLVDAIDTYQAALAELETKANRRTAAKETRMEKTPASYDDIKLLCPGADATFICSQLEKKATEDQARSTWMEEQNRRAEEQKRHLAASEKARIDAEKVAADAKATAEAKRPGVQPLKDQASADTAGMDPIADWNEAVAAKVGVGLAKDRAIRAVVHENHDLHQAYIEAVNVSRKKKSA